MKKYTKYSVDPKDILQSAVYTLLENKLSSQQIREAVEEVLREVVPFDTQVTENRKIIDQYRHCFIADDANVIEKQYVEGYISNVIDAARGKSS